MDTVPPDTGHSPTAPQDIQKTTKIIPFAPPQRRQKAWATKKEPLMDLKVKLDNYRSIFNNSPKGGAVEKRALEKIALLSKDLPDDDKDKYDFVRLAVDFYDGGNEALLKELYDLFTVMTDKVVDKEDQLRGYRVLLRHKFTDDTVKEIVSLKMLDILDAAE